MAESTQIVSTLPTPQPPPRHVAIIMDGNGRWAQARNLPRKLGHREGVEAVRRTVRAAVEQGISYLTIYSFSSENWTRPRTEISDLMGLMKLFIKRDLLNLHRSNVRILVIGERDGVDPELMQMIDEGCHTTRDNTGLTLVIAFNYGSRFEIAKAARALAREVLNGNLSPDAITPERFGAQLDTTGIPDPDLLIRTSGELRLSNFLLWQSAYTEFVFLDVNWPDFDATHLAQAIAQYHERERRYGGRQQQRAAQ